MLSVEVKRSGMALSPFALKRDKQLRAHRITALPLICHQQTVNPYISTHIQLPTHSLIMQTSDVTTSTSAVDDRAGLTWALGGFFEKMRPQWKSGPSIDAITKNVRRELAIPESEGCKVEFLAKGTFNKMYVHRESDGYIVRVSLPVQPRLKTLSEHAVINYVLQHTTIPVPQIIASDACNNNGSNLSG